MRGIGTTGIAAISLMVAACSGADGGAPEGEVAMDMSPGQTLYEANCTECHGSGGLGDGPLASSLPVPPVNLLEHLYHHTDEQLIAIVRGGLPPAMPPVDIAGAEVLQIFEYLRTLAPEGADMEPMEGMDMDMPTGGGESGGMPGMPMEGAGSQTPATGTDGAMPMPVGR